MPWLSTVTSPLRGFIATHKGLEGALSEAVGNTKLEVVRVLVKAGVNVNWGSDMTPLMEAASRGATGIVRELLQAGANPQTRNKNGQTALDMAPSGSGTVRLLQEALGKPDPLALVEAERLGRTEAVRAHVESHVNVDIQDRGYKTALFCASECGHVEAVRLLVKAKAGVDMANAYGRTPLMWAAHKGHVEVVRALIEGKAQVDEVGDDSFGLTPLMYAARSGHMAVIRELAQANANLEMTSHQGRTALMIAARHGNVEAVQELLHSGADPTVGFPRGSANVTAIILAGKKHHDVVKPAVNAWSARETCFLLPRLGLSASCVS